MKNFIQEGDRIEIVATAAVSSGDLVFAGNIPCVALTGAAEGEIFVAQTKGVFEIPKDSNAMGQGIPLYWDDTNNRATATATGNKFIGFSFDAALAGDSTVTSFLIGASETTPVAAKVAAVSTANATDPTTVIALANANKAAINAILTALTNAGLMSAS